MSSKPQALFMSANLRLTLLAALILALLSLPLSAENITFNDAWNDPGVQLLSYNGAGTDVTFSLDRFSLEDFEIDGELMKNVYLPGVILPNDAGAPNLPGFGRYIAIPEGARAIVRILQSRTETYTNLEIAPAAPIQRENDDSPPVYEKNPAIYNVDALYPESPVKLSEPTQIRGVDVVTLGISPFQYNPVTKELVVHRDLVVRVEYQGGSGQFGEDRLRSRYFDPILRSNLLNFDQLPEMDYDLVQAQQTDEDNVEYLIIVPDDPVFLMWADTLKQWRKQQGIITGITTISEIGGNNSTMIENYINNAYNNWAIPPAAVLLLSDYQSSGDVYGITSPIWNNYCASDNIYADVDGNDLPDMVFARITAQTYQHLATMIGKMMDYERTPPTDPGFYQHPITAGGWQTARWFILCTEVCWGFMHNELGKDPVREYAIYSGTPGTQWSSNQNTGMVVQYFGPQGLGYIPATPSHLTDWGANATRINNDINDGAFLLLHRDHGSNTGWGEPDYQMSDLNGLNNDMLPYVFSINCLTGEFNWSSTCFAEAFHRMEQGALGVMAASEVSYSFVNDTYIFGIWDSMWPEFDPGYGQPATPYNLKPAFANASGKYYLSASNWPYNPQNKDETYHLFHHHGDAFMTINSEIPQNLNVSHNAALLGGASDFTVTADAGAIIALTVDNEIIGVAEATGAPQSISIEPQLPGNTMLVTITLYNHFRYMQDVPIVPPEGPYVAFNNVEINDASAWIPNGQLDFGETVYLDMTVENIGVEIAPAVDVTIETEDIYTTILDDNAFFGNINAGALATVNDAFQIEVTPDVPDGHDIAFSLHAACGDSIWISYFSLEAHAPVVEYTELLIEDPTGNNNNQLDPGETADFNITVTNEGSCTATNIEVTISTSEPLITIPVTLATIAELAAGESATVTYSGIIADPGIPVGINADFDLEITADGGFFGEDMFTITVGDIRYQPSGPDTYGYMAYDMYDNQAVFYDWIEIAPSAGGQGTILTLGDDQTGHANLPFNFMYYGTNYSEVSICSNGWMAFGYTTSTTYTNAGIPGTGNPQTMVAAFWDDLNPNNGGQICWFYDQANSRYIVEWYQVPHYGSGGGPETFQIILYDPSVYITPTGDGNLLVNYHTQANSGSCTLGIENSAGNIGLQFLYNGTYHTNAMPLESSFAIMYSTGFEMPDVTVTAEPLGTPIVIPANGGSFDWEITIENTGTSIANFTAWTTATLPSGIETGALILRPGLGLAPGGNIFRLLTQNIPARAPAGDYTYNAYVGGYPGNILSEDHFTFEKAAGDADPNSPYDNWNVEGWDVDPPEVANNLPAEFFMEQNFPNPFNPVTTINFGLPEEGLIKLEVFNVLGRKVAILADGKMEAGYHQVVWNATTMSSGVYFYKITAGDHTMIKKCILMK